MKNKVKLSQHNINKFTKDGFSLIENFLEKKIVDKIKNEIKFLKKKKKDIYVDKNKGLRRIEKVTNYSTQTDKICKSNYLIKTINRITKKKLILFKDKINFAQFKSSGFKPHIDGHFYWRDEKQTIQKGWEKYGNVFFTVAIALQDCSLSNGCLHLASKQDTLSTLGKNWEDITKKLKKFTPEVKSKDQKSFKFFPVAMKLGDMLIFDWKCAHFSETSQSKQARMILYLTFGEKKEGNQREIYYKDKNTSKNPIKLKSLQ